MDSGRPPHQLYCSNLTPASLYDTDAGALLFPARRNATKHYSAWGRFALVARFASESGLIRPVPQPCRPVSLAFSRSARHAYGRSTRPRRSGAAPDTAGLPAQPLQHRSRQIVRRFRCPEHIDCECDEFGMAQCPPVYVSSRPDSSYETSRAKGKCHMSGAEKNENAATGKQRAAHDGVSIYLVNLLPKAVHVRCEPEGKQHSGVYFFIRCIRGSAIKQTGKVGQVRYVKSDGNFVKRNAQCDPQTANPAAAHPF